ncbi:transposase [Silanimonas sp.]|uniref:transposase n=1 Tax=Silanimonas sp. TaxID=1929290 RepID=UPI0022BBBECB|nr:transposase [Silanimonas sp.]MCZ8116245.1 transposase [Silanimonas sp.]
MRQPRLVLQADQVADLLHRQLSRWHRPSRFFEPRRVRVTSSAPTPIPASRQTGHAKSESSVTPIRNPRSRSPGIAGHDRSEYTHKAKTVREWLAEHRGRIEVFYLPPYSPELNPTECFNGDLKGEIQRGLPPKDVKELKRAMLGHSRRIQKSPHRVRGYFRHRNIRYAA